MKPSKLKIVHILLIAVVLASLLSGVTAHPANAVSTVLYVAPGGQTSGGCANWATACELHYALPLAVAGQELWVKTGTYKPTTTNLGNTREAYFQLKNDVAVYGGFAGSETLRDQRNWTTNVTLLSGDQNGDDAGFTSNTENSYHVVMGATGATLDGLTISGGNANASNPYDRGGGILNHVANTTLSNVIISGNAANVGGGMYNDGGAPSLSNVLFDGNAAGYSGGGMQNYNGSNPTLTNLTFNSNTAPWAGGMLNNASSPILTGVTFYDNRATSQYGGGMRNENNSRPVLTNVTFKNNRAANFGGGMNNDGSSPTLTNVTFSGNSVNSGAPLVFGGGMSNMNSSPVLTNVTFTGNAVSGGTTSGGGAMFNASSPTQVRNSIFWGNSTPGNLNGPSIINSNSGGGKITKSVFFGACAVNWDCTELIGADPLLGTLGNYGGGTETVPLLPGSSAIDATSTNCPTTDQRGITRSALACDIGAFESRGFTLAINGVAAQSTGISKAFSLPLTVLVTSTNSEPVTGGRVTFTSPASGASATLATSPASISASGSASVTATANSTVGWPYNVSASALGASSLNFALTNLQTYMVIYNGNGSTGGSAPVDSGSPYIAGNTVTVLGAGTLVRTGYTFNGWNTQTDGLGTSYTATNTFTMPAANVTLYARWTDGTLPSVTDFTAASPENSYTISITSFNASDNVAVTGYMITESSTPPLAGADGWIDPAPITYTASINGVYTLYPWAKDAAGNISLVYSSPVIININVQAQIFFLYLPMVMR